MAGIYVDQHCELSELLSRANNEQGATLLIPDLQRPYVWSPRQVVLLIDSLVRGWPFGTFLTWKVKKDDPVRELARSFWEKVDRTDGDSGQQASKKHPPGSFQMVLDGQQRIQSVLLAVCRDDSGFKLYDRDWRIALTDQKPRGRQGAKHWSLGCLCIDLEALVTSYAKTKRLMNVDFANVLVWIVTGGVPAQSHALKKPNYQEPLPRTHDANSKGRYVRLSRLWNAAPAVEGVEQEQAEGLAETLLKDNDVPEAKLQAAVRPIGSLLLTLTRVKKTRVTYLELAEFDENTSTRESYNDAVVNIFTRLNTAGRTLTREDITFAWLKVGWIPEKTSNQSAAECFDDLADLLKAQKLELTIEDVVAGVSLLWSAFHAAGRVLSNNDLLKGDAIRPMAAELSNNWRTLSSAIETATATIADRGYRFREHFESLNSIYILWAWQYIAEKWIAAHPCKAPEKDGFEKSVAEVLAKYVDRWLMCSQWAGRWAVASAETIAGYAKQLAVYADKVQAAITREAAVEKLEEFLAVEVKALEGDALLGVQAIQARRKELVRIYYAPLWIWHRLEKSRWQMSKIQLRTNKQKKMNLDVDHTVAYALWERTIGKKLPTDIEDKEEALTMVNQIGNCALIEKTFNISKSDRTLKSFLEEVHELKTGKVATKDWASALDIPDCMIEPNTDEVDALAKAISARDELIREDLAEFVTGKASRVDLEGG